MTARNIAIGCIFALLVVAVLIVSAWASRNHDTE
jgi:hypothetical protein